MIGPDRIEWRRGFPRLALRRFVWTAAVAAIISAAVWIFFGTEPERLASGRPNPLAALPLWTIVVALAACSVAAVQVVRRPLVAANHYALSVRPGSVRTLLLPWAAVGAVVVMNCAGERYLLIRLGRDRLAGVDRPGRRDQGALREAQRRCAGVTDYDLAVRLREFAGTPTGNLATLAAYAPEAVLITEL